ncbi:MAG TPA: hypothetical protein VMX55_06675 [candidate division Zixibacteria bacterium]|nr:hypothetical protein [candidate division Zixibacteria bacterium]
MGKKKEDIDTCDYSTVKPEPIKFLTEDQTAIVGDYIIIINALREKNMTAKDIHNLYYDEDKKDHTYTIKTIYRYIEKLENAGLIKESGYRITKGTRLCEKMYSRTAKIFYGKFVESNEDWWDTEEGKNWCKDISTVLGELLEKPDINHIAFYETFKSFAKKQYRIIYEVLEKTNKNEKLQEIYTRHSIEKINKMNYYVSILSVLFREPEFLKEFLAILEK